MAVVELIGPIAIPRVLSRMFRQQGYRFRARGKIDAFAIRTPEAAPEVDCVLVDFDLTENLKALSNFLSNAAARGLAVVMLGTRPNPADVITAMKLGASDFLLKPVSEPVLREAIETAVSRGRRNRARASRISFLKERYRTLTYQEQLAARLVSEGARNKDVAESLGVAERTVKIYRTLALKKLDVHSVPELVRALALLDSGPDPDSYAR
ncbi:LuxR C-terminal-related transcriptional regulator [Variovorax sp. J2P1-59]|uniref:response regulator transcription factor n=1 Tax=Variovorax flavidus TaxID=3053501 RepID=UPI002575C17C|nr:LuxR C-terminal-related transcriptional regulator [Variovorax sp. J2P1-59]MDM0078886.1 LuxR C-terminal-related transcriptional regulator [Variovorax sp. J2P1-59]